jgi:hypothetical protein
MSSKMAFDLRPLKFGRQKFSVHKPSKQPKSLQSRGVVPSVSEDHVLAAAGSAAECLIRRPACRKSKVRSLSHP